MQLKESQEYQLKVELSNGVEPIIIPKALADKYSNTFQFFASKAISQIVYDHHFEQVVIEYKDMLRYLDVNQYLKRYYFFENTEGRRQIDERIKVLTGFYAENLMMSFEYPTMIITRTSHIFNRRFNRLQRIGDGYGSSNNSQINQKPSLPSICGSFSYLKQQPSQVLQNKSEDEDLNCLENMLLESSQYSSSVYNIFEEEHDCEKVNEPKLVFREICQEKQIQHLVCDFHDLDEHRVQLQHQQLLCIKCNKNLIGQNINQYHIQHWTHKINRPRQYSNSIHSPSANNKKASINQKISIQNKGIVQRLIKQKQSSPQNQVFVTTPKRSQKTFQSFEPCSSFQVPETNSQKQTTTKVYQNYLKQIERRHQQAVKKQKRQLFYIKNELQVKKLFYKSEARLNDPIQPHKIDINKLIVTPAEEQYAVKRSMNMSSPNRQKKMIYNNLNGLNNIYSDRNAQVKGDLSRSPSWNYKQLEWKSGQRQTEGNSPKGKLHQLTNKTGYTNNTRPSFEFHNAEEDNSNLFYKRNDKLYSMNFERKASPDRVGYQKIVQQRDTYPGKHYGFTKPQQLQEQTLGLPLEQQYIRRQLQKQQGVAIDPRNVRQAPQPIRNIIRHVKSTQALGSVSENRFITSPFKIRLKS